MITPVTDHIPPNGNSHAARLRAYLNSRPEWCVKQAEKCINEGTPDRLLKPLAGSVADDCLGTPLSSERGCHCREQAEGDGVRTTKKTRCISCKKRIGAHEPDLVPKNLATGTLRLFHTRCDEATAELVLDEVIPYHPMIRYVEAERN